MTNPDYIIAESDELEALGRDDHLYDTSAGLSPDDVPGLPSPFSAPSRGRRFALILVLTLSVAAVAAVLSVVLRSKGGSESSAPPSAQGIPPTTAATSPPALLASEAPASSTAPTTRPKPSKTPTPIEPLPLPAPPLSPAPVAPVTTYAVRILSSAPHDEMAFTQGFEYFDGFFYEGTGLHGGSSLRRVELSTGRVVQKRGLPDRYFGEGITVADAHRIVMLTWQSGIGFVFNRTTFKKIGQWRYTGEGWGLATDRTRNEIYMSDGTSELRVLDIQTLKEKRRVNVTLRKSRVIWLNEIEWICNEVWANVWQTSLIYRIDPASGRVKSVIDASILPPKEDRTPTMNVLNGIASDPATGRIWLTGKKWKKVYLVNVTDDSLDITKCS